MNRNVLLATLSLILTLCYVSNSSAEDWLRFRGPNGSGVSQDKKSLPAEFSDSKNLKWKYKVPGPGHSCPIVVGDKVFITCWTGYGTDPENVGKQEDLKRHLICIDRKTGKKIWIADVPAELPEDKYAGMFAQHGYASHTPVSDGNNVYVFFGKTGVLAYNMNGEKQWQQKVGDGLDQRRWGSACSPVLYKDKVIVLASAESQTLYALNKSDGEVAWKQKYDSLSGAWSTPIMVKVDDERTDLVVSIPYEIWGLNPENGKLRWYFETGENNSQSSSAVFDGERIVQLGGRGSSTVSIKKGGKDDVKSKVAWTSGTRGGIGSPIAHDGYVYNVSSKTAACYKADNGDKVYEERIKLPAQPRESAGKGGGGRGGYGRGNFGASDYSSPVIADGKIFYVSRKGNIVVLQAGDKFEQLAVNKFESDKGDFSATPAISDGQLFIRSSNYLYCIEESEKKSD